MKGSFSSSPSTASFDRLLQRVPADDEIRYEVNQQQLPRGERQCLFNSHRAKEQHYRNGNEAEPCPGAEFFVFMFVCHDSLLLDFKIQTAAMDGVGTHLTVSHSHVFGVLGITLKGVLALQRAIEHHVSIR